jgi:hypothetical protein
MLKQMLFKAFSIILAFLVLLSTVSFALAKHYCGTTLIDVAVFSKAETCDMEMTSIVKKHCCKDEIVVIKGQDKLKLSKFEELPTYHQVFITTYIFSILNRFESIDKNIIPHKDYSPPNLVTNIQVLDQVFII